MADQEDLGRRIIATDIAGENHAEQMSAPLDVFSGESVCPAQTGEEWQLKAASITKTLDVNGNVLVAGENYLLGEKEVKVLREELGGANFMCTYQRVYYLDSSFEEQAEVVDGRLVDGPFAAPEYQSTFKPVDTSAAE